jgi:broad specificity phosphatase PhoE
MGTTVFLVRHGVTGWHAEGRVLGQRDLPMNDEGRRQAEGVAALLSSRPLSDVVTSPLQRAVATAEAIGAPHGLQPARDARLTDFRLGQWSGMTTAEIAADPQYQRFLANPLSQEIPGGETLADVLRRSTAAVDQAVADSFRSDAIAIVSHAGVIRVLLAHYIGAAPASYHHFRVSPGSISVLRFTELGELPRVLAVNHGVDLDDVLRKA